jgi:hypothetical protein
VSLLVEIIFQTVNLYDDRPSRKAVDELIMQSLNQLAFMKSFAASLVQLMERFSKNQSPFGCYRLLKWSSFLLKWPVSKGGFSRLASAQAVLYQAAMQGSLGTVRACKRLFSHLFSEVVSLSFFLME